MHLSMGAAAVALYAMLGFESAAVAAGRVKDPERTIPRATLIGTLIVAAFYVAIVAIGMLVVPQATLATSDAPAVTIVDHLLGPGNGRWISLFVVISGLGCLNGWTLLSSELTRTLAANHLLPPVLGESNRFGAPWASLLLAGALATFVGLMNYSATLVGAFTKLSLIVSAANLPLYVCCSVALFVMLRRSPAGLSPLLWIAGAGGVAFAAFAFFGVGWEAVHLGAGARPRRRADLLLDARSTRIGADTRRLSREDAEAHVPRDRATRARIAGDGFARAARQPARQTGDACPHPGNRTRAALPHRPQRRRPAHAPQPHARPAAVRGVAGRGADQPVLPVDDRPHCARRGAVQLRPADVLPAAIGGLAYGLRTFEPRRRHDPARLRRLPQVRGAPAATSPTPSRTT